MVTFAEWLDEQLRERGLRPADLARMSGVDNGIISRALNEARMPSNKSLDKIATALRIPKEEIYRAAGVLPPITYRETLIKRIEEKAGKLTDPKDIERVERFIDLLAGDDDKRRKRSPRPRGAASSP